jgi:peptidoglycan hydrolase CwlO-like protein
MKNNVKELEMTIEKCANDIGEFNKEIKRAKAEIRKLKKVAETGPQETEE